MITNKCSWSVAALVSLASVAGGLRYGGDAHASLPASRALWAFETDNPRALVAHADVIALVEAVATNPGRIATSENGEDVLPFELTEFRALDMVKGSSADGRIYVERVGGIDPKTGDVVSIDIDGGVFEAGGTYLLFLKQGTEDGAHVVINDQGRFLIQDGLLHAVGGSDRRVARVFADRSVPQAMAAVRRLL